MRTRPKALPHPVLTPFSDDVSPNAFDLRWPPHHLSCDLANWSIASEIEHSNGTIAQLVAAKKATYGIHVECPRTFFRKWYPQQTSTIAIEISTERIWGRVEVAAFCVAVSDITDYRISGQHSDYGQASFDIRSGDILAYAATEEFDAFLDIDPIRKISSILDIKRSPDRVAGPALIDFNGARIEVDLSQTDWRNYIELRSDSAVRGLLASNVVFPAILQAMNYIKALDGQELEDAKNDMRWCRSLVAKLEKAGIPLAGTAEQIFRSAQDVLKEPVHRGLSDLLKQLHGGEQ
jgi:hypothetical protein